LTFVVWRQIFSVFPIMSQPALDVRYVANLARIDLSDEEVTQFQDQLSKVLEYVEQLKRVDVSSVDVTAHAHQIFNVFREDTPRPGLEKSQPWPTRRIPPTASSWSPK